MTSEKATFTQIEHAILEAIREDNAVALKQLYCTFEKIFVDVAINEKLIIKSFNAKSVKCFGFLVDKVTYHSKSKEIQKIKDYITKNIEGNQQEYISFQLLPMTRSVEELNMMEKIDSQEIREHILRLLDKGLTPWSSPYVYNLFLQNKNSSPLEQLSLASCEDEKMMCLNLLSAEVDTNTNNY